MMWNESWRSLALFILCCRKYIEKDRIMRYDGNVIITNEKEYEKVFFSENIYFLILFTLPAAFNVIFNSYIRTVPVMKEDKSVELAECIVFCLAVFLANVLLMEDELIQFTNYSMTPEDEKKIFCLKNNFDYVSFLVRYFVLNFFSSIGILFLWYVFGQKLWRCIANLINKIRKRPIEQKYSDVWTNIFETNTVVDINYCIIQIIKSGELVSAGLIKLFSSPIKVNKEFALYNTDLIKQLFEDDQGKTPDERMFKQAICEYYDIQNDVLIKFYDTTKYDEVYAQEQEP